MNNVFYLYLDKFMVVDLNDIMVYSSSMEEHVWHFRTTFQVIKKNDLNVKRENVFLDKKG